ncbi:hypothetical protein DF046_36430 [Burkholderia cepacia]|nr:hypothetical protein WJ06_04495 [Burkholderia cepacia]KWC89633.1 hypothetical protein WL58_04725 [Burkholderia cepacia]RQT43229.1 hypothetical protein DF046_36430 [Burkholderia cepacia]
MKQYIDDHNLDIWLSGRWTCCCSRRQHLVKKWNPRVRLTCWSRHGELFLKIMLILLALSYQMCQKIIDHVLSMRWRTLLVGETCKLSGSLSTLFASRIHMTSSVNLS